MLARDVRELFLLPFVRATETDRLRGRASGVLGTVLSANASVALDALLARGHCRPSDALATLLEGMLERTHPDGRFLEPYEVDTHGSSVRVDSVRVTAEYLRILMAFGKSRDRRIRAALDWLSEQQEDDGAFRPSRAELVENDLLSYTLTRSVAAAFAEMPATLVRRYATVRRRLAAAFADRVLDRMDDPDAVVTEVYVAKDPCGPHRGKGAPPMPPGLADRVLYFTLEDLRLALAIGASPEHPHLAPWIEWIRDSQFADGHWKLADPSLRERLLLSDPNGRLRAEALYLTDDWITLRAAQVLRLVETRGTGSSAATSRKKAGARV
jgi:hypothetical protein